MKITEIIPARRSVRTYDGRALDGATVRKIKEYIATLRAPFGARCRVELVSAPAGESPRLGTYGAIRGASDYLALIVGGEEALDVEGAAYLFEQVVLYCTSLGLGTCWLAGFRDRGGFKKGLSLGPGEKLRSTSPVGYAAEKAHRSISTLVTGGKPTTRRPFGELFFDGEFGRPLTVEAAGVWARPLEMVRMGPSANNKQSWRVVVSDGAGGARGAGVAVHFYEAPSMGYERLDAGIALCHFGETCRETGIDGRWEVVDDAPVAIKAKYVASWVA